MMKFGVCRGLRDLEAVKIAKAAGFDYLEPSFTDVATAPETVIADYAAALKEFSIPCEAANSFLPGDMKIVGPAVDYGAVREHLERGFSRASGLGIRTAVFGSGGARSRPEDFPEEEAYAQVVRFLSEFAAPAAAKYGCVIAIEPLSFGESGMIHTVAQGVQLARDSAATNVFGLADLYHVANNKDDIDGIASFSGMLAHTHLARPLTREYPRVTDPEETLDIYRRFLAASEKAGCSRCSVEARTENFSLHAYLAAAVLRELSE